MSTLTRPPDRIVASPPDRDAPVVAVWRNELLPLSETFIADQARALWNYHPVFVGRTRANAELFQLRDSIVIADQGPIRSRLDAAIYSATRRSGYLSNQLAERRPALIHAHFGNQAVYALPFARALGIPLVTTFHGQDATRPAAQIARSRNLAWRLYANHHDELIAQGSLFIAVSEPIRAHLIAAGFPPERVVVHHIGVDTSRFTFRDETPNNQRIVTVCRLVEKKGTEFLIRAAAKLVNDVPGLEVRIVGDGPLRPHLEELVRQLGIDRAVQFLGARPPAAVRDELAGSAVFCLPSVTAADGNTEGLPISILEAMAIGVPVVATHHAGIPEAVAHGESGLLAPERDVDALSAALRSLLQAPALRVEFARHGRNRVERAFDLYTQAHELERLYDRVRLDPGWRR